MIMDTSGIRRGLTFLAGIVLSLLTAGVVSPVILAVAGLTGAIGFLAGFILYAIIFFAILGVIERVTGFRFFVFPGSGMMTDNKK